MEMWKYAVLPPPATHPTPADNSGSVESWIYGNVPLLFLIMLESWKSRRVEMMITAIVESPSRITPVRI